MNQAYRNIIDRFNTKHTQVDMCWVWHAAVGDDGYGVFRMKGKLYKAHRASYVLFKGPVPAGLHIDHLCRNRQCVNPEHLEAVTQTVNNQRAAAAKTHCPSGHDYKIYGRIWGKVSKARYCIQCNREKTRARRALAKIQNK